MGHNTGCTGRATTPKKVKASVACSDEQCCSPPSFSCSPSSPSEFQPRKRCPTEKQNAATEAIAAEKSAEDAAKAAERVEKSVEHAAKFAKRVAKVQEKRIAKEAEKEGETCAVHNGYDRAVRSLSIGEPIEGKPTCENSSCKSPPESMR